MLQEITKLRKGADPEKVEKAIALLRKLNPEAEIDIIGLREGVAMLVGNTKAKSAFDEFNEAVNIINDVKAPQRRSSKEEAITE